LAISDSAFILLLYKKNKKGNYSNMERRTIEKVALIVLNKSGVLGRVAGHIRHEGWNIKRLLVDEIEDGDSGRDYRDASRMEIDIEGVHTKLAQVMDRLLNLDCVISIEMFDAEGGKLVRTRPRDTALTAVEERPLGKAPPKQAGCFRILAINPLYLYQICGLRQ
jgi:ACT domain-containing protein